MNDKYRDAICYLDTNIFVYVHDDTDLQKRDISQELCQWFLQNRSGRISVQVISEWRNTIIKKFSNTINSEERKKHLRIFQSWQPLSVTPDIILKADELCDRYHFSAYDSIHVQCALEQNCQYFLSEDMQDGLVVNDTLTLYNPFQ